MNATAAKPMSRLFAVKPTLRHVSRLAGLAGAGPRGEVRTGYGATFAVLYAKVGRLGLAQADLLRKFVVRPLHYQIGTGCYPTIARAGLRPGASTLSQSWQGIDHQLALTQQKLGGEAVGGTRLGMGAAQAWPARCAAPYVPLAGQFGVRRSPLDDSIWQREDCGSRTGRSLARFVARDRLRCPMKTTADLLFDGHAVLAEGPVYSAADTRFCGSISRRISFIASIHSRAKEEMNIGQAVGAVVLREAGGLAIAMRDGFAVTERWGGALTMVGSPEKDKPENRMNDGKCDCAGRFWAGTMGLKEGAGAALSIGSTPTIRFTRW